MERSLQKSAEIILSSKYAIALTGAGISVESGIRPFRGPGGLWTERGEPSMNGYRRFKEDPKRYWKQRIDPIRKTHGFGSSMQEAKPNPGHYALVELEKLGILKSLITQNIDNLHIVAGSKNIYEIHGNVKKLRCIECNTRFSMNGFELTEIPPLCTFCGGIIKSDTVMFGEPIPTATLTKCLEESYRSDCIIVIGTSAMVFPAAALPINIKRKGGSLIELNPRQSEISRICDVTVRAPSGLSLPRLVTIIKQRINKS
jgi:NAD-dependent deacetylase